MFSVSLCSRVFDPNGAVMLEATPDSELSAVTRRVSRVATLDGAATIEDLGYTASDSTLNVQVKIRDPATEALILRMVQIYPLMTLATRYGAFLGVVDYYKTQAGGASLRFIVQRQLSL